jgi:hypothetical protein
MKPLLICLLLIIYTNIVRGQNFIYNGDFEICKSGNPACGSVPDNNNYCGSGCRELQYVDGDWFDVKRGIHGTVDWWKGPYFCYAWTAASTAANSPNDCLSGQYAESGSNFIGLFVPSLASRECEPILGLRPISKTDLCPIPET